MRQDGLKAVAIPYIDSLTALEVQATHESFAKSGWQGFLQHRAAYMEELSKRQYVNPLVIAEFHARLGNRERALDLLEKALENRAAGLWFLKHSDRYDNLRTNPRFEDLLQKVGFPQ
jgi:hypothetical protein